MKKTIITLLLFIITTTTMPASKLKPRYNISSLFNDENLCLICKNFTSEKYNYKSYHIYTHIGKYTCDSCNTMLSSRLSLKAHKCSTKRSVHCNNCNSYFSTSSTYSSHLCCHKDKLSNDTLAIISTLQHTPPRIVICCTNELLRREGKEPALSLADLDDD